MPREKSAVRAARLYEAGHIRASDRSDDVGFNSFFRKGWKRFYLKWYLGLITPNRDECRIFVDGRPYSWRDGADLVFDETYVHRFENRTDETRIILFCDVERPLRTPVMRALNRFVIRHVVGMTATRTSTASPSVSRTASSRASTGCAPLSSASRTRTGSRTTRASTC